MLENSDRETLATIMRSVVGEYLNQQLTGELITEIGKKLTTEIEIFLSKE